MVQDKQQAVLAALERRRGMDPKSARELTAHFEKQDDLYTQCPRCGTQLRGTLAQIKEHNCDAD